MNIDRYCKIIKQVKERGKIDNTACVGLGAELKKEKRRLLSRQVDCFGETTLEFMDEVSEALYGCSTDGLVSKFDMEEKLQDYFEAHNYKKADKIYNNIAIIVGEEEANRIANNVR